MRLCVFTFDGAEGEVGVGKVVRPALTDIGRATDVARRARCDIPLSTAASEIFSMDSMSTGRPGASEVPAGGSEAMPARGRR